MSSFATTRIVYNGVQSPGQYSTVQAAVTAASAGDTILVQPSVSSYGPFSVDKKLYIFGIGIIPGRANNTTSIIDGGVLTFSNAAAANSVISGFIFVGGINMLSGIHDITISRNYFTQSGITFNANYNITVAENVFITGGQMLYGQSTLCNNILASNNVFLHSGNAGQSMIYGWSITTNMVFTNNVFYCSTNSGFPSFFGSGGVANAMFTNNIFNKVNFSSVPVSSTWINNLTYNCSNNSPWASGIDGGSNVSNTSPQFVLQSNVDGGTFMYCNTCFAVNTGSPTLSSGTGDPDMGVYGGGVYSWTNSSMPAIPYVYSLQVVNPTIQSGTNLEITVTGKKHN